MIRVEFPKKYISTSEWTAKVRWVKENIEYPEWTMDSGYWISGAYLEPEDYLAFKLKFGV